MWVGTINRVGTGTYNRIMIRKIKVGHKSSGIYTFIPSWSHHPTSDLIDATPAT